MKVSVLTLFIVPFVLGWGSHNPIKDKAKSNKVVLELFTSQGCSSCPPADALLKDLNSSVVIALSYHVDYWNYIGWADPFSKADFTQKQRNYASKFNNSSIYTPMIVIKGKEHLVGSRANEIKIKINRYSSEDGKAKIAVKDAKSNGEYITFNYNIEDVPNQTLIRVVLLIDERKTEVKRGENRNRTLINSNIVVAEQRFKLNKLASNGTVLIPEIVDPCDNLSLVLILENEDLDIITATQTSL